MGWLIFLLIVAGIILIIVLRKKKQKKENLEKFYKSAAFHIAGQIRDELTKNGYSGGYSFYPDGWSLFYWGSDYGFAGTLPFSKGDKTIGEVIIDFRPRNIFKAGDIERKNTYAQTGRFYVIQNDLFGLYVISDEESKEIPPFIEIAARVIQNSGYNFRHPDWWFESEPHAREYLNVMFQ